MELKKIMKSVTIGSWLQIPNNFTAEIMAKAGFDWLAIDLEHGLIDLNKCFEMIQIIELAGVVPLVRLNENDSSVIRRVMDAGAHGVIVPMVNSLKDAQSAVNAVKYPPEGERSFGLGRAHEYGKTFNDYIKSINSKSLLIIQIEHIEAVNNLDSILKIKDIDAVLIGPYDLSGSMGIPGKFSDIRYKKVIDLIVKKVRNAGLPLGIHIVYPSKYELKRRISQGFSFIGYGVDTIYLSENIENELENIKGIRQSRDINARKT